MCYMRACNQINNILYTMLISEDNKRGDEDKPGPHVVVVLQCSSGSLCPAVSMSIRRNEGILG